MNLPPLPDSLWRATRSGGIEAPPLHGRRTCDVVVVGGGYTGLHAALTLAEAGRDVVLVEAGSPWIGASGRNGGVVSAKFRRSFPDLARAHGLDMARTMRAVAAASVAHLRDTIDRFGMQQADLRLTGSLKCAHSRRAFDHLRADADWQRANLGETGLHVLGAEETARETGSGAFAGGLLQDGTGTIRPLDYLAGLWAAAGRSGVALHAQTPALAVTERSDGVHLTLRSGEIVARHAILATNAYSGLTPVGRDLSRSIVPFRSAMVATDRLPEDLDRSVLRENRSYTETRRMMRWFRKVDGRVIFGGRGALGAHDSPSAFRRLEHAMRGLFPVLDGVSIAYRWSGQVALSLDGLPHAGACSDRVSYAAGFNGAGVAMSGYVGHQLARGVLGQPVELGLIARDRLPRVPLYPLRAIGARSAAFSYEMLDRIGL